MWSIQRGHELPPNRELGFLRYASSTLLNHLKTCARQTQENRSNARHEVVSPRKSNASGSTRPSTQPLWPLSTTGNLSTLQHSPQHSLMLPPSVPPTRTCSPAVSTSSLSALPSPYSGLMLSLDPSPQPSPGQSFSNHPTPRSQLQSILIDDSSMWLPDFQKKFEERIARLTVSAGLPLLWVDDPEWIDFINFVPSVRSPSQKVLTNYLILAATKNH